MNTFLSETYNKPKLVESKLVKRIIENQSKTKSYMIMSIKNIIIEFIKNNYIIIIIIGIIIIALYWRYRHAQQKKNDKLISDEDSDL